METDSCVSILGLNKRDCVYSNNRNSLFIRYVLQDETVISLGNDTLRLSEGDLCILLAGTVHAIGFSNGKNI